MKIAFLHYHARRGGITRVIEQQMDALRGEADCMFLSGNGTDPETGVVPVTIPGIGYDGVRPEEAPEKIADDVLRAVEAKWPSGCDILHVHNPVLKKNRDFLKILRRLADRGLRLFLQVHDTAEDLRPHSYYFDEEYPENCHYGVINSRDYRLFIDAGLRPEGLHRIFNVVQPLPRDENVDAKSGRRFLLYAVRAIRRKNLGEALLLSCFVPRGYRIGITLPPTSPADYPSYEEWKSFAVENRLSVDFELGLGHSLGELVARSALMITTSIREGFGFSFLEPWTADRAVVGRRLEAVAQDFSDMGVDLSTLYDRIAVPLDLIDAGKLRSLWIRTVEMLCEQYGMDLPFDTAEAWSAVTRGDLVDFAFMDSGTAAGLVGLCRRDEEVRVRLVRENPRLGSLIDPMRNEELIRRNHRTILEKYNGEKYRSNLLDIYGKVLSTKVSQRIDKKKLLGSFLTPDNVLLGGM